MDVKLVTYCSKYLPIVLWYQSQSLLTFYMPSYPWTMVEWDNTAANI